MLKEYTESKLKCMFTKTVSDATRQHLNVSLANEKSKTILAKSQIHGDSSTVLVDGASIAPVVELFINDNFEDRVVRTTDIIKGEKWKLQASVTVQSVQIDQGEPLVVVRFSKKDSNIVDLEAINCKGITTAFSLHMKNFIKPEIATPECEDDGDHTPPL